MNNNNDVSSKKDYCVGHRKRMREKFLSSNIGAMHDYEILEMLLFFVIPRRDIKIKAKKIIEYFGGLEKVFDASIQELVQVIEITESTAFLIKLVRDVVYRYTKNKIKSKEYVLGNWIAITDYLKGNIAYSSTEKLIVLFLKKNYSFINDYFQEIGTVDNTPVYVKEIVKKALMYNASYLVIAHNHPNSNNKPSDADIFITEKLRQACFFVDMKLLDHVIVTEHNSFSFAEHNLL